MGSEEVTSDTELCKSFDEAKVFVEADLSKDVPKHYRFKSDKGVDSVVEFKYHWLPPRCSSFLRWGHLAESCLKNMVQKTVLSKHKASGVSVFAQENLTPETKEDNAGSEAHLDSG